MPDYISCWLNISLVSEDPKDIWEIRTEIYNTDSVLHLLKPVEVLTVEYLFVPCAIYNTCKYIDNEITKLKILGIL